MLRISVWWKRALIALGLVLAPAYLPVCVILSGQRDIYKTVGCGPAQQTHIPGNPGSGLFSGCGNPKWDHESLVAHMTISTIFTLVVAIGLTIAFRVAKRLDEAVRADRFEAVISAPATLLEIKTGAAPPHSRPFPRFTRPGSVPVP